MALPPRGPLAGGMPLLLRGPVAEDRPPGPCPTKISRDSLYYSGRLANSYD